MGMSRIEIVVTGNHGCDRKAKEGETLQRCSRPDCIDCRAADFVDQLRAAGAYMGAPGKSPSGMAYNAKTGAAFFEHATMTHWPTDDNGGIIDDLVQGKRVRGSF